MRRAIKALVLTAVVGTFWAPTQARAEGYISPFAGVNFGSTSIVNRPTYGVDAGWMGAGVIGAEAEFGYSPKFFGDSFDNHVLDAMANLIVGVPIGGTRGPGIRPYVTGGVGLIQVQIAPGVTSVGEYKTNDFGFNLGAGAMGYFSNHVGIRGDVRYFRTIDNNSSGNDLNLDLGGFDFWRASVGLVIR
jgi:opacity protein-like surface antigen